jgi:hypothetical protein
MKSIKTMFPMLESFPKIMVHDKSEVIILAVGNEINGDFIGTCIYTGKSNNTLGKYSSSWSPDFHDFKGIITLEN